MSRPRGIGGVVVVAITLAMMGCGGGSGGGSNTGPPAGGTSPPPTSTVSGNGLAPATGPGDTQGYFPSALGDTWSFNYVTTDTTALSSSAVVNVTASGTKTVNGVAGTIFARSDPTLSSGGYEQFFAVSAGGVSLLGNNDAGDPITALITPYAELLFPVQVGPVSTLTGTGLAFGKDSSGHAVTLDLTQTIANAAFETVDVPAGTFTNVIRQTTAVSATAHDNGQTTPPITANQTTWIAPGAGEIKEQITSSNNGVDISSAAELRGFVLDNQHHGLGGAIDLNPAIVNAGCNMGVATIVPPRVASDGTHFVAVAHQCDGSSGTARYKWIAWLLLADGTVQSTIDLSSSVSNSQGYGLHATIAFDGTNYLVVYEDDATVTTFDTANLKSVLLSPTGTVLSGPTQVGVSYTDPAVLAGDGQALSFDGNRYLLIYTDETATARPPQLSGLFISRSTGQADGTPFTISSTNIGSHLQPALGFDGTNYLAVWYEPGANPKGILAERISSSGALLDSAPLLVMDNSGPGMSSNCCDFENLQPSVSFDGTNYLVTYRDVRGASPYTGAAKISAARVSPGGVLLDGTAAVAGIAVTSASGVVIGSVRSAFLNGAHWIVWSSGVLTPTALNASRVSVSGQVPSVWPNGFSLVASSGSAVEVLPALAASTGGGMFTWIQLPDSVTAPGAMLRSMPVYP